MTSLEKSISVDVEEGGARVSGLFLRPENSRSLLVFGHGAGAGMKHPFMTEIAHGLAERGVATLRYQFPYIEAGRKRPDPKPVLLATVRAAVSRAKDLDKKLPLFVGGKSMGGRMSSMAMAQNPISGVKGIVFFGFPLHPPGMPSVDRAAHLADVKVPMLFLQGTRDKLADLTLLKPVIKTLGKRAHLHIIEGGEHSFHLPKSQGKTDAAVLDDLSETAVQWMSLIVH